MDTQHISSHEHDRSVDHGHLFPAGQGGAMMLENEVVTFCCEDHNFEITVAYCGLMVEYG